jgi:L-ascorbate metabolism protein UlaG (beta-lactamase superfamily)
MPNVIGLREWETTEINTPLVPGLKITATPAQHRPGWIPEFLTGKVIGFIIEYDEQVDGCIYISGDTVYFNGIDEIGHRFKVDIAFFNVGCVQFRYLTAWARYTMNGDDYVKSSIAVNPKHIVPLHYQGWTHFKEGLAELKKSVSRHPETAAKTMLADPGKRTCIK